MYRYTFHDCLEIQRIVNYSSIQLSFMQQLVDEMAYIQNFSKQMDYFSEWIKAPKEDIEKARKIGNQIYEWIKKNGNFEIDRICYGGSFAKETSTFLKFDVDVVIYVRYDGRMDTTSDILEFLENVRNDWKRVLMLKTNLTESDLSKGKNAVKFELGGYPFDLCPAIDFSKDPYEKIRLWIREENCSKLQTIEDYFGSKGKGHLTTRIKDGQHYFLKNNTENIARICALSTLPDPIHTRTKNFMPKFSTALGPYQSEAAVDFVKSQSCFVKKLCRITKFWQQSVAYFEYIAGRSFIFECLAIR